jgi:hypothetical protein
VGGAVTEMDGTDTGADRMFDTAEGLKRAELTE